MDRNNYLRFALEFSAILVIGASLVFLARGDQGFAAYLILFSIAFRLQMNAIGRMK